MAGGPAATTQASRICTHGQWAGAPTSSRQFPQHTCISARARFARFSMRRVLPIPGSPLTRVRLPAPPTARASAASRSALSRRRPTNPASAARTGASPDPSMAAFCHNRVRGSTRGARTPHGAARRNSRPAAPPGGTTSVTAVRTAPESAWHEWMVSRVGRHAFLASSSLVSPVEQCTPGANVDRRFDSTARPPLPRTVRRRGRPNVHEARHLPPPQPKISRQGRQGFAQLRACAETLASLARGLIPGAVAAPRGPTTPRPRSRSRRRCTRGTPGRSRGRARSPPPAPPERR